MSPARAREKKVFLLTEVFHEQGLMQNLLLWIFCSISVNNDGRCCMTLALSVQFIDI
jgi:hypothetical protein